VIILSVSNEVLEQLLEPDDGRFWLILRDLGINPAGSTHMIVTIFREPLTESDLYANIDEARRELDALANESELPF